MEILGALEYLRHYADTQLDAEGIVRKVWLFEFKIHQQPLTVPLAYDRIIANETITASRQVAAQSPEDDEIVNIDGREQSHGIEQVENVRRKLLELSPRGFEFFVRDLLIHCGFDNVCVTKYSSDGGVDVRATTGARIWVFEGMLVQVQAKRWMHSVGRKEVAELRGSLQPFAKGTILTTSHFSKAAINEAHETGKNPIGLIDGAHLAQLVLGEKFQF
jgi:restriction system protein